MPFLPPNQQRQSTEGTHTTQLKIRCLICFKAEEKTEQECSPGRKAKKLDEIFHMQTTFVRTQSSGRKKQVKAVNEPFVESRK